MEAISYKTKHVNKSTADKQWLIVDAKDKVLGRVSSEIAKMIRGKHKPSFSPHVDCGDNVIVINADQIRLTGNKWDAKEYISHSGYPGGQKRLTPRDVVRKKSTTELVKFAVKGMLPKNRLGRQLIKNLFVYEGAEHPHEAQKPTEVTL